MAYRSENNKFPNKENYKDLNMTLYPNHLDDRISNVNMKGFTNVGEGRQPDYVMAEYVNSALDSIMAIQRTLGAKPSVYKGASPQDIVNIVETFTVKDRLDRIEDGLFDERYGGKGWIFNPARPTLNNHNHSGKNGQPPQINLTNEVKNKLSRLNINLTNTSEGLNSSHILVNSGTTVTIEKALEDNLSKSKGGTISGPLVLKNSFNSRTRKEIVASDIITNETNKIVNDNTSTDKKALICSGTVSSQILNLDISNMLFGKYSCSMRVKSSSVENINIIRARTDIQNKIFTGADFNKVNEWKQIYFIFEVNEKLRNNNIVIEKLNTSNQTSISFDNIIIETIHPGVLDR